MLFPVEKKQPIEEVIIEINQMDADELKIFYKKKLRDSRLSEKGGAGLGFMDMVKNRLRIYSVNIKRGIKNESI